MPVGKEYNEIFVVDDNDTQQEISSVHANGKKNSNEQCFGEERIELSELPFLVTHWLSAYQLPSDSNETSAKLNNNDIQTQHEAIGKIHRAAAEIASAFSSLALFGKSVTHPSLDPSSIPRQSTCENRTFFDIKRQWAATCPPNQLNVLVSAAKAATETVDSTISQTNKATNLVASARENFINAVNKPKAGRTLLDNHSIATVDENDLESNDNYQKSQLTLTSPVLLLKNTPNNTGIASEATAANNPLSYTIQSAHKQVAFEAASAFRRYFDIRRRYTNEITQRQSTKRSLEYNKSLLKVLIRQRDSLLARQTNQALGRSVPAELTQIHTNYMNIDDKSPDSILTALDDVDCKEQNCKRVIAQLERQLPTLDATLKFDITGLTDARSTLCELYKQSQSVSMNYRDPIPTSFGKDTFFNNRLLSNLQSRQLGCVDRCLGRTVLSSIGRSRRFGAYIENNRSLLYNRFSHAATINTHLHYPVYCLRFDQTGRYFITGADDALVRVFCLGETIMPRKHGLVDRSTYCRGAVLVCTLKGHAGVVNDICVSTDNAFLATASEDGDCRVWGLKDGSPVAILRGHKGGANMVSWSALTPYRLVTTSVDGFARVWDIREACVKRYAKVIGKRPEYQLKSVGQTTIQTNSKEESLPERSSNGNDSSIRDSTLRDIPLPPLPERPIASNQQESAEYVALNNVNHESQRGEFVYNDKLDKGVRLISKLQHERVLAPDTVSARQIPPKVICIARCPYGSHFATGSDDGICRIWRDEDHAEVDKTEAELCGRKVPAINSSHSTRKSVDPLLFLLRAHVNAITDLVYSSVGDRILTASQKDGEVKIVSWRPDQSQTKKSGLGSSPVKRSSGGNSSFIQIKLVNPTAIHSTATTLPSKRRASRVPPSHRVSCDVATWLNDDSKIVTSQSELMKADGSEIVPGSHHLFLWDSYNGNCLLGIAGSHSRPCPVLLSHPIDSNITCSAGTDGVMKLLDWETGRCIFSHSNVATFGPLEDDQVGKNIGFLDGSFSPDGTKLVLTDDTGRILLFDCNKLNSVKPATWPGWMREQYFSNDYYDVVYDETGYCVEKGSERPPHLAPRGSRASHTGEPVEGRINDIFSRLSGPLPLSVEVCRLNRECVRRRAAEIIDATQSYREKLEKHFDPLTTILISDGQAVSVAMIEDVPTIDAAGGSVPRNASSVPSNTNRSAQTGRTLSSNWRWGDAYADDLRDGDADPESASDDEEFEINDTRAQDERDRRIDYLDDLTRGSDDESEERPHRQGATSAMTSRVSSRNRRSRLHDSEVDSDDSAIEEVLSTNNHPSGVFKEDYIYHYFKLSNRYPISRSWVRRTESRTSYNGRKKYTPQIGDLVVYIPRAHLDTVNNFDILRSPWKDWPSNVSWPVVQCRVRNIRYRFPFLNVCNKGITGSSCTSVVAILSLEIVGVPVNEQERKFPWPSPSFIAPIDEVLFELSLFESNEVEFIFPSSLYISRLERLELVHSSVLEHETIAVEVYYAQDNKIEDEDFQSYTGTLSRIEESNDLVDPAIRGSGHNCVTVTWDSDSHDRFSPWDIRVLSVSEVEMEASCLEENDKKGMRRTLSKLMDQPIYNAFREPVDENKYIDYSLRVAVPMDLSFIERRLASNYYTTKSSLAADMRLIVENCIKYNGEQDNLSTLAKQMLQSFETDILSTEDIAFFHQFSTPISTGPYSGLPIPQIHQNGSHQTNRRIGRVNRIPGNARASRAMPGSNRGNRASVASMRSSLEALPQPRRPATNRQRSTGIVIRRNQNNRFTGSAENDGTRSRRIQHDGDTTSPGRRSSRERQGHLSARTSHSEMGACLDSPQGVQLQVLRDQRAIRRNDIRVDVSTSGRDRSAAESALNENQRTRDEGIASGIRIRDRSSVHRNAEANDSLAALAVAHNDSDDSDTPARDRQTRLSGRIRVRTQQVQSRSRSDSQRPNSSRSRATRSQTAGQIDSDYMDEREIADEGDSGQSSSEESKETVSHSDHQKSRAMAGEDVESDVTSSKSKSESSDDDSDDDNEGQATSSGEERSDNPSDNDSQQPKRKIRRQESSPQRRKRPVQTNSHFVDGRIGREPQHKIIVRLRSSDKRPTRRTAGGQKTYQVPESDDDFDDGSVSGSVQSSSEDDAVESEMNRKRKSSQKNTRPRKKAHQYISSIPTVNNWDELKPRLIKQFAKEIVSRLQQLDEGKLFSAPVLETYPELIGIYDKAVKIPMDFRTILDRRIGMYNSISELRHDLITVFKNCIRFNTIQTEEGQLACIMLNSMNDIYREVCEHHFLRS